MTLQELLKDKELGHDGVRVRKFNWPGRQWFSPMYTLNGYYYGHWDDYCTIKLDYNDSGWELYEEPKPTLEERVEKLEKLILV